jgi:hypothetical protein
MTTAPNITYISFLDWDDTCLSSSDLSDGGYRLDSNSPTGEFANKLTDLETSVIDLITHLLKRGKVIIVTNAEDRWVQLSAAKFMPKVVPMLERVTIISARSTHESMFPNSPLKWKFYTFQNQIAALDIIDGVSHVISFGDSHVEREAIRAAVRGFPNMVLKSLKFAERPNVEQLYRQQQLVINSLSYIFDHPGDQRYKINCYG